MANKSQPMNRNLMFLGGAIIIALGLVLVGMYGKNLTTVAYIPILAGKCASQAQKDTATPEKISALATKLDQTKFLIISTEERIAALWLVIIDTQAGGENADELFRQYNERVARLEVLKAEKEMTSSALNNLRILSILPVCP